MNELTKFDWLIWFMRVSCFSIFFKFIDIDD